MRVVLCQPNVEVPLRYSKPIENLGIAYVAGALRQSPVIDVAIVDALLLELTRTETVRAILEHAPRVVGFSVVFNYFPAEVAAIANALKAQDPGLSVVVGGHASSFIPENILRAHPEIDAVVVGEGEAAMLDLCEALSRGETPDRTQGVVWRDDEGTLRRQPVQRIGNLARLPRPARDTVPALLEHDGIVCLSTSRGCYARCTFCSIPRFYGLEKGARHASGAWLSRDPVDSVDEIEALYDRFKLLELLIVDDEFFGGTSESHDIARAFADELAARQLPTRFALSCRAENVDEGVFQRLAAAGVAHVFVGVETGLPEDLKLFGKKHSTDQNTRAIRIIKQAGMSVQAGFMLFNHRTTLDRLLDNLEYMRLIGELKPWHVNSAVQPYFGTPLADLMLREGGAQVSDLDNSAEYPDPETRRARELVADISEFFIPFQGAVLRMSSAITIEWRRRLPWRSKDLFSAIGALEKRIHLAFAELLFEALHLMRDGAGDVDLGAHLARRKAEITPALQTDIGLTTLEIQAEEGEMRYYTQADLIRWYALREGRRDVISSSA